MVLNLLGFRLTVFLLCLQVLQASFLRITPDHFPLLLSGAVFDRGCSSGSLGLCESRR